MAAATLPVASLDAGDRVGCRIDGPGGGWGVLFRRDGRRTGQPASFTVDGSGPSRILVTGLVAGKWRAQRLGGGETKPVQVAEDQGAAWFEAAPGAWTLTRE